jgi:FixJ family two-component response regulator
MTRPPNPKLKLGDTPLRELVGKIVERLVNEYGEDKFQYALDLRAAVDSYVEHNISMALLAGATWKQIGEHLGVSAQAAHRKYRHLSP